MRISSLLLPAALVYAIILLLLCSWVTEDAFITLRVIDNFLHGYGLTWNIDERVQVYTHPLWLGVLLPFYALTGEPFFTPLAVSFLCILGVFFLLYRSYGKKAPLALALFFILFAGSKALREFSSSGLETPLSFLLITLLFLETKRAAPRIFFLGLWLGLLACNRLDMLLFALPALYCLYSSFSYRQTGVFALGLLPLLAWLGFATLYYGFPLPNTYYAKLHTGIPAWQYAAQGAFYFGEWLLRDWFSAATLPFLAALLLRRGPALTFYWLIAILLYSCYVVRVGGDFMSGRFWSVPYFAALLLLLDNWAENPPVFLNRHLPLWLPLVAIAGAWLPSFAANVFYSGVADERAYYRETNSLLTHQPEQSYLVQKGLAYATKAGDAPMAVTEENIGMMGYYAGPHLLFIDILGLTDPLLARMPFDKAVRPQPHEYYWFDWRIGHFYRSVPKGYVAARQSGDLSSMDPALAIYYGALRSIISDPVFSARRLKTLWQFYRGDYDIYRQTYLVLGTQY